MARTLKISENGDGGTIRVPREVYNVLKGQENLRFTVKLTDEGMLYQPVTDTEIPEEDLPQWLKDYQERTA